MKQFPSLPRRSYEEGGIPTVMLTCALFRFEDILGPDGKPTGKKEKVQNLTPEERAVRRRYQRSRQMAPKRFAQPIQLQVEAWAEVVAKRAIEDARKAEKEKLEAEADIILPGWMQLLDGEEIEFVR